MKPETCFALPSQKSQQEEEMANPSELSGAARRKLFTRRTSQDLIQLQGAAQLSSPATQVNNISSQGLRGDEQAQQSTHRSILKSGRSSRSPSPSRRVSFHSDVLIWAAAEDGDLKMVKKLLLADQEKAECSSTDSDKSATCMDVNMSNHENVTLLHLLCFLRDLEAVRIVLKLGAKTRTVDREGWTPLHIAVALGLRDIAHLLLDSGAETDFPEGSGVLDLARVSDAPHVLPLVEELKAKSIVLLAQSA